VRGKRSRLHIQTGGIGGSLWAGEGVEQSGFVAMMLGGEGKGRSSVDRVLGVVPTELGRQWMLDVDVALTADGGGWYDDDGMMV